MLRPLATRRCGTSVAFLHDGRSEVAEVATPTPKVLNLTKVTISRTNRQWRVGISRHMPKSSFQLSRRPVRRAGPESNRCSRYSPPRNQQQCQNTANQSRRKFANGRNEAESPSSLPGFAIAPLSARLLISSIAPPVPFARLQRSTYHRPFPSRQSEHQNQRFHPHPLPSNQECFCLASSSESLALEAASNDASEISFLALVICQHP